METSLTQILQQLTVNQATMQRQIEIQGSRYEQLMAIVKKPGSLIDTRGIGKPDQFSGSENEWTSWRFRFETWISSQIPEAAMLMQWAESQDDTISKSDLEEKSLEHEI